MTAFVQHITTATKSTLSERTRLAAFLLFTPLVAYLLFLIPVRTIPGNDVRFQASLFSPSDYLLLLAVAALESLLVLMWWHLWRRSRLTTKRPGLSRDSLGLLGGLPAFLFGTKLCPMCVAGMLGFLGPGAVFFAVEHRLWFFAISAGVLLVSIYSVSKKINGVCEYCVTNTLVSPESNQ